MKVKCPSCGKAVQTPDVSPKRTLACACKYTFNASSADIIEGTPSSSQGFDSPSLVSGPVSFEDQMEDIESAMSDTDLDRYIGDLQKSRQEISSIERKKSEEDAQSNPRFKLSAEPIDIDDEFKVAKDLSSPAIEKDETPEDTVTVDFSQTDKISNAPPESTVLAAEKQLKARAAQKAQRKKDPSAPLPSQAEIPKTRKWDFKDFEPFLRNRYFLISFTVVIFSIVLGIALWLKEPPPPETPPDPYLTKLLTPVKPGLTTTTQIQKQPAAAIPTPASEAKPVATKAPVARSTQEDEDDLDSSSDIYKKMRTAAFKNDHENIIRIATGTGQQLGEEERALYLEASIIRAGANKARLREIYLRLSEERRNHPNAGAFVRTQAVSMLYQPVSNRDLLTSLDLLKSLSLTRSRDPFVFYYLGQVYEKLGRMDLAHSTWEQTLILAPQFIAVIDHRLKLYMQDENWPKARELAERLSSNSETAYSGFMKMADIAAKQGKKEESMAFYRKAVEIDGRADASLELANQLRDQGKFEDALRQYEAALKADAKTNLRKEIHLNRGITQCRMKQFDEAFQAFHSALSQQKGAKNYRIMFHKGLCELDAEMPKRATLSFQSGLKSNPSHADGWYYYGVALTRTKKFKASIDPFKRSLAIRKTDRALYGLAYSLVQMKSNKEAKARLDEALALNPKNREALALRKKLGK